MPLNNPVTRIIVKTGTYDGNSTVNRAIPHGLSKTPKLVIISQYQHTTGSSGLICQIVTGVALIIASVSGLSSGLAVTAMDSTNFYVGNATEYRNSANLNDSIRHYWVAIG